MLTVLSPSSTSFARAVSVTATLFSPSGMMTVSGKTKSSLLLYSCTVRSPCGVVFLEMVSLQPFASPSRMVDLSVARLNIGPSSSVIVIGTTTEACLSPMASQLQSEMYTAAFRLTTRSPSFSALSFTPTGKLAVVVPAGNVILLTE